MLFVPHVPRKWLVAYAFAHSPRSLAPLTRPAHSPRSLALLTRSKEEKAEDLEKRSEEEKVRAEEEAKVSDPLYHQSVGVAQTIAMVRALLYPSTLAPLTSQSERPTSLHDCFTSCTWKEASLSTPPLNPT